MASTLAPPRWHHPPPPSTGTSPGRLLHLSRSAVPARRGQLGRASTVSPRAFFGRADLDGLLQRAWRGANAGAERLSFEARQAAQRLDGRYSISRRVAEAARAARERAAEIDAELGVGRRWRSFSVDFSRSWPRTLTFLWLALSGWLFRIFIFSTFVLPFAAPLLLGTFANRVAIEGSCPACKRRFVGYRNQVIRCMNCQNIVWQPNSRSSGGGGGGGSRSSGPDYIDVEFEEK
ncbi:hypothetical protein ACQJBY_002153 [Aegilops geniculata]